MVSFLVAPVPCLENCLEHFLYPPIVSNQAATDFFLPSLISKVKCVGLGEARDSLPPGTEMVAEKTQSNNLCKEMEHRGCELGRGGEGVGRGRDGSNPQLVSCV